LKNSTLAPLCDGKISLCPLSDSIPACTVSGLATTRQCGQITLIWDEVDGATQYEIQRAIGNNTEASFATIATPSAGTTSYADKNVITVTTTNPAQQFRYFYRLRAKAASGVWSAYSDPYPSGGEYSYCYRGNDVEEY
jgi:hypothetical protein